MSRLLDVYLHEQLVEFLEQNQTDELIFVCFTLIFPQ
jgi:hypothetical protein